MRIYIKDSFNANEFFSTADISTECLCINVILSQNMHFIFLFQWYIILSRCALQRYVKT